MTDGIEPLFVWIRVYELTDFESRMIAPLLPNKSCGINEAIPRLIEAGLKAQKPKRSKPISHPFFDIGSGYRERDTPDICEASGWKGVSTRAAASRLTSRSRCCLRYAA